VATPPYLTSVCFCPNQRYTDTKHDGVLILKRGAMTETADVVWQGGLLVGQSSPEVCTMCQRRSSLDASDADPGCHNKLSTKSYNKASPFTAAVGLRSSVFAIEFTSGPGAAAGKQRQPGKLPCSVLKPAAAANCAEAFVQRFVATSKAITL
jgi:hypothetical protein